MKFIWTYVFGLPFWCFRYDISNLQVLLFKHWSQKVQSLRRTFKKLTFKHISKKFNEDADSLSKEVLFQNFGTTIIQEFMEGAMIFETVYDFKEFL